MAKVNLLPDEDRCPQISGLHAVVVCLLLGAVVLVVGLVQLVPGATTTNHRLALLVAGAVLLILGEPSYTWESLLLAFISTLRSTRRALAEQAKMFNGSIHKRVPCRVLAKGLNTFSPMILSSRENIPGLFRANLLIIVKVIISI